jgi:hypothetical protein
MPCGSGVNRVLTVIGRPGRRTIGLRWPDFGRTRPRSVGHCCAQLSSIPAGQLMHAPVAELLADLYRSDASPLRAQWKIVQRPDSKRDRRALSALLGDLPEILCELGPERG